MFLRDEECLSKFKVALLQGNHRDGNLGNRFCYPQSGRKGSISFFSNGQRLAVPVKGLKS